MVQEEVQERVRARVTRQNKFKKEIEDKQLTEAFVVPSSGRQGGLAAGRVSGATHRRRPSQQEGLHPSLRSTNPRLTVHLAIQETPDDPTINVRPAHVRHRVYL